LKTEMQSRGIQMPKVVNKEEYIENASATLGLTIKNFEQQFQIKTSNTDWQLVNSKVTEYALSKGIDVSQLHVPFSKSEYFTLAETKLNMSHWELTNMLWNTYQPNKIWYVVFGVGIVSVVAILIYDRFVVRPLEKKAE